jgi:trehalose 6-phosphate synthase/phosphatase
MEACKLQVSLQTVHMPGNKYNCSPVTPRTRLERLLREREIRKSNRCFLSSEEARDCNREAEIPVNDSCSTENNNLGLPSEEEFLNGVAAARTFLADGCKRQDGRPSKQRLLVVANRLPVSAIRRGEDSWQLEFSAGGLVTALLGK